MRLNLLLTTTLISLASSAVLLPRQDQAKLGTTCTDGAKNVCSMNLLAIVSTYDCYHAKLSSDANRSGKF